MFALKHTREEERHRKSKSHLINVGGNVKCNICEYVYALANHDERIGSDFPLCKQKLTCIVCETRVSDGEKQPESMIIQLKFEHSLYLCC